MLIFWFSVPPGVANATCDFLEGFYLQNPKMHDSNVSEVAFSVIRVIKGHRGHFSRSVSKKTLCIVYLYYGTLMLYIIIFQLILSTIETITNIELAVYLNYDLKVTSK